MLGVVVAIVAALLVIGAVVTYRMARSNDTVESFRRQIDALSPEARRGVVDQVNRIDDAAIDTAIDDTAIDDTCDRRHLRSTTTGLAGEPLPDGIADTDGHCRPAGR